MCTFHGKGNERVYPDLYALSSRFDSRLEHQRYLFRFIMVFLSSNTQMTAQHFGLFVEKKNKLDSTEWFIALIICSTCFGHFYAHHQELETLCVLLTPMVCNALFAGGRRSVAGSRLRVRDEGCCSTLVEQQPLFRTHSLQPCT